VIGYPYDDAWLFDHTTATWRLLAGDADTPLPGSNLMVGLPPLRRGRLHAFTEPSGDQMLLLWGGA